MTSWDEFTSAVEDLQAAVNKGEVPTYLLDPIYVITDWTEEVDGYDYE